VTFAPFIVGTCEAGGRAERSLPFSPRAGSPFEPFEVHDPFGLRRAVVPVFRRNSEGRIYGMGTAFHVHGWNAFLTAYHVVDFIESGDLPRAISSADMTINANGDQPILFLGLNGVIFGSVGIPPEQFAPVTRVTCLFQEKEDPIAELQGKSALEPAEDIAILHPGYHPNATAPHTVRIAGTEWVPRKDEYVFAIGYAELNCQVLDECARQALLSEGLYGSYARITAVRNYGHNPHRANSMFEVEGDWRSGMSGGPIFNADGHVVGLVSRSIAPSDGQPGIGCAVNLIQLSQSMAG
jgi:serine protease Do